jgi:hypothetical protein
VTAGLRSVLLLAAAAALAAGIRASAVPPDDDFLRYRAAGALVLRGEGEKIYASALPAQGPDGGLRDGALRPGEAEAGWRAGRPFRQPPGAAVLDAPLGALPLRAGWVLWSAAVAAILAAGAGAATALALRRLGPGGHPWIPFAAAVLPLLPLYLADAGAGQWNAWLFGLSILAVLALDRGRDAAAGLLAGTLAAVKVVPVLLVLWFAWRRRWRAAAWGLGGLVLVSCVLPAAAFGPVAALALTSRWRRMPDPLVTEMDERAGSMASPGTMACEGQSAGALLARYFSRTPFNRLRDRPLEAPRAGEPLVYVNGGREWDGKVLRWAWLAVAFGLLAATILATAPEDPSASPDPGRFPLEAGVVLAVLALLAPESRALHMISLAPLLAALAAGIHGATGTARRATAAAVAAGGLLLFLPSDLVVGRPAANEMLARGAPFFGGLVLLVAGLATLWSADEAAGAAPAGAAS